MNTIIGSMFWAFPMPLPIQTIGNVFYLTPKFSIYMSRNRYRSATVRCTFKTKTGYLVLGVLIPHKTWWYSLKVRRPLMFAYTERAIFTNISTNIWWCIAQCSLVVTRWGLNKIADLLQKTISNAIPVRKRSHLQDTCIQRFSYWLIWLWIIIGNANVLVTYRAYT